MSKDELLKNALTQKLKNIDVIVDSNCNVFFKSLNKELFYTCYTKNRNPDKMVFALQTSEPTPYSISTLIIFVSFSGEIIDNDKFNAEELIKFLNE